MDVENQQKHLCGDQTIKHEFSFQELQKNYIFFNKTTQLYQCTVCKLLVSGVELAYAHTNDLHHKKLFQEKIEESAKQEDLNSQLNYEKFVENKIARSEKQNFYKCYLCNLDFLDDFLEEINNHINVILHKELSERYMRKSQIALLEISAKTLVENTITLENNNFYCNVCQKTLSSTFNVTQHVKGKTHYLYWKKGKQNRFLKKTFGEEKLTASDENNKSSPKNKAAGEKNEAISVTLPSSKTKVDNQECDKGLTKSITSFKSGNIVYDANKLSSSKTHLNETDDQQLTFKLLFKNCIANYKNSQFLACYLCQCLLTMNDSKLLLDHISSEKHKELIFRSKKTNVVVKKVKLSESRYQKFVKNAVIFKISFYFCNICQTRIYSLIDIDRHMNGKSHKNAIARLTKENEKSHPKFLLNEETLSKSLESQLKIESDHIDQHLPNQVKAIAEKVIKKVPKQRKTKNEEKFPYNQDVLSFSDRYIVKCLQSGTDNIYYIDSEKIRLMLLGNSLVFDSKNEKICILCNYKFPKNIQFLLEHLQHDVHIKNLCEVEESSKELNEDSGQFTDMELIRSCMVDESDECIRCCACDVAMCNLDDDIKIHINLDSHISKMKIWEKEVNSRSEILSMIVKDLWYFTDKFCCRVCNLTFSREISFAKHLDDSDHIEKEKLSKSVNTINICFACCSCWYGESDYVNHYKENVHNHFMRVNQFLFSGIKEPARRLLRFASKNIKNFVIESDRVSFQKDKEELLINTIEETVKSIYADCKAYIFGSRNSSLSFCSSDVDLFLDCENNYQNIGSKEACQKYINAIKNQFYIKNRAAWKNITVLLQPRVPLIKCEHKKTGLKCDISFISGLAVEKTKLIRSYVIAYPPCREMILFLKKWFDATSLYGPQAVNAYGISWCVIFYLQIKGVLPSVYQLINLKNASNIIDGWECGFPETIPVAAASNYDSKDLLVEFFTFYAEFDYCNNVICPLIGKVLQKNTFIAVDNFPKEMEMYKKRFESEEMEYFRFDSPMCVHDPVDLSQNITKAVKKKQLRYFKSYCKESIQFLREF